MGGLKYARLVIGLVKSNSTLGWGQEYRRNKICHASKRSLCILQYARLVMYFSEDRNTEGLLYAWPVIGLIKYNRTLGLCSVFLRTGLWED